MPSRTPPTSPTTLDGSPPDLTKEQLRLPTVEIYSDPNPPTKEECSKEGTWTERGSKYAKARSQLDYEYHGVCTREREQYVLPFDQLSPCAAASRADLFPLCPILLLL
jgi:hypothetical protein